MSYKHENDMRILLKHIKFIPQTSGTGHAEYILYGKSLKYDQLNFHTLKILKQET